MKNLIIYVVEPGSRQDLETIRRHLDLQIENSLALGWHPTDLLVYTNFPYASQGVSAVDSEPQPRPATARIASFHKTQCILQALETLNDDEICWYHDVDAYQLKPLPEEPSRRALAFCLDSAQRRLLVQSGSLFLRKSSRPIFEYVDQRLREGCRNDEHALTEATRSPRFLDWFDTLNYSYNLGTTDFALRYQLARKPILVAHFHLQRQDHRDILLEGHNPLGVRVLDDRFMALVHKHGFSTAKVVHKRHSQLFRLASYIFRRLIGHLAKLSKRSSPSAWRSSSPGW